ncbi:response regulator transcription factor [Polynucleobacter sp. AP-Kaivos-20-H2]|uniref:response regulator transcription factor n=1 Tax=Polynucleobacter sp. AP-Kaivos-20-H2 TaxID=2689104 RepID=UPI001C0E841B|nr:response regulator [Polynucleobacter sp. AP-Kaivos-20-H2]MBU3604876.1 response regulator transcription factor [Polynucleobacter sp. AP-Kaivos-20-H2]
MNSKKYIFLVEDDDELRSDLERALQFCGYTIFSFASPEQFLSEFKPVVPAVLVSDMRMPKQSGIQLQSELIAKGHKIPIIFISGESSDEQIVKAFKNGAFDFLLKPFSREAFLSAVAKAIEQDTVAMQELIRKSQLTEALKTLSPRERQVFNLLAKGYGNKELVDELGISLPTVKEYKSEVMYKLRLRSLAELIALNTSLSAS